MKKVEVYSIGPCYLSVCAENEVSIKEITEQVNQEHPTGLNHGWKLSKKAAFLDGTDMPCPCDRHSETRKHYLFNC